MLSEKEYMHLTDVPPEVRQVAEWIAEQFESTALWPTQGQVWRYLVDQGMNHSKVVNEGGQVFNNLDMSPRDDKFVQLRLWALYDTSRCRRAMDCAWQVFCKTVERLKRESKATMTRTDLANNLGVPEDSKEAHQATWVAFAAFGGQTPDEKGTMGAWSMEFSIGALRIPAPTMDERLLCRPEKLALRAWPSSEPTANLSTKHRWNLGLDSSTKVFVGHGRSGLWRELKDFLRDRLHLDIEEYNTEAAAGVATTERLDQMLDACGFAFLVMTAEDQHADGRHHARENVVHEVGLFQGRLGFKRAIVVLEEGCAQFSNIVGLGQIRFPAGKIGAAFEDIRRVLEREGVLPDGSDN